MDEYTVEIGGIIHTMLLNKEDAERLGAKIVAQPKNKARTPNNKG